MLFPEILEALKVPSCGVFCAVIASPSARGEAEPIAANATIDISVDIINKVLQPESALE